uniref:Zgc:163014 n=1 Tax=Myripristis murdjan TaxID=586833 RepID=A0A667Y7R5_9TELE
FTCAWGAYLMSTDHLPFIILWGPSGRASLVDKMGRLTFYVLWSLRDAPRQFISKSNRRCFQVHIPLPLPKQLLIFGLGEWKCSESTISVEVLVSEEVKAQKIGTLSSQTRCLIWEGDWAPDIVTEAAEKGRRGVYGKIVLTVCGQVGDFLPKAVMKMGKMCIKVKRKCINVAWLSVCPSKRWSHALCLSDPDTAILIGGETSDQNYCKDSAWKLEIDNDFWFPMTSSTSEPIPPCACGHSATYDPDSKAVFVYGGLREGQRYNELYILDTLAWKWRLVTAKGNVPNLAYHSAVVYKKELYIFGGVQPSRSPVDQTCSNALYIFNPEFELWYQPIVEGEKPLSRFGHSATLLSDKLLIFGGRKTATYLNDLHMLDLGFMEYTAVKCDNMPPLPRGFHAALPVSENRMLISGGCSAVGALQDVHIFNVDTNMWSSLVCPLLCSKPRAGHSIINLDYSSLANIQSQKQGKHGNIQCTLLVFGGSDCSGTFYNDTIKCKVEIPGDK